MSIYQWVKGVIPFFNQLKTPKMSYRFFFALIFIFCFESPHAQTVNLVPNPSFEERLFCIWNDGTPDDAPPWFNPWTNISSTPDVFHACTIVNENPCPIPVSFNLSQWAYGVPTNFQGCEGPSSGEGYAGIYFYAEGGKPEFSYREYLAVELDEVLMEGELYEVSFHVSLADRFRYAIWAFQVAFLDTLYLTNEPDDILLPFNPQLTHSAGDFVSDYEGWTKIEWTYIAQGNEKFMYIGNFQPNSEIHTLTVGDPLWPLSPTSYYFIDDVFVGFAMNTSSSETVKIDTQEVMVYPNPTSDIIYVEFFALNSAITDFVLWDLTGKKQLEGRFEKAKDASLNLGQLPAGMYLLEIRSDLGARNLVKVLKR